MMGKTREEKIKQRHDEIIDAACSCFIAKGFHQTGMRDIARVAGVSLGNLYNHFENKEALVAEIAKLEAEEINILLKQTIEANNNPIEAIEAFSLEHLENFSLPDNMSLSSEILSEALRNPPVATSFLENAKTLNQVLADVISKAQDLGQVDKDLIPLEASAFLLDAIEGLAIRNALQGREVDDESFSTALRFIRKYLGIKSDIDYV